LHENASLPFVEVFVDAPLHVVEQRDPKGLYKKARAGEIEGVRQSHVLQDRSPSHDPPEFTGISAPYEIPERPEIHIKTAETNVTESVRIIMEYLINKGFISV
jgi:adenylylsulfate kinase